MNTPPEFPVPGTRAITALAVEQACRLLREVGSIANAAMTISHRSPSELDDLDEVDDLHSRMQTLRLMVDRMGWVADVGLRTLGGEPMMARAEDWMLPGVHPLPA